MGIYFELTRRVYKGGDSRQLSISVKSLIYQCSFSGSNIDISHPLAIEMNGVSIQLVLCCIALFVAVAESRQPQSIVEEWRETYHRVFDVYEIKWEEAKLSDLVMFLYSRLDEVRNAESVTQAMVDNVRYSYDILTDIDTAHCNAAHMDTIKGRLMQIRGAIDSNLEVMFALSHRNLVEICGVLHEEAAEYLDNVLEKLRWILQYTFGVHYKRILDRQFSEDLQQDVYKKLKLGRFFSEEEYVNAWSTRGPCRQLENALVKGGFKSFIEFAEFNGYNGYANAQSCQPAIRDWALAIYRCARIDKPILEMHKKNPSEPNRFVKFFKSLRKSSSH